MILLKNLLFSDLITKTKNLPLLYDDYGEVLYLSVCMNKTLATQCIFQKKISKLITKIVMIRIITLNVENVITFLKLKVE